MRFDARTLPYLAPGDRPDGACSSSRRSSTRSTSRSRTSQLAGFHAASYSFTGLDNPRRLLHDTAVRRVDEAHRLLPDRLDDPRADGARHDPRPRDAPRARAAPPPRRRGRRARVGPARGDGRVRLVRLRAAARDARPRALVAERELPVDLPAARRVDREHVAERRVLDADVLGRAAEPADGGDRGRRDRGRIDAATARAGRASR